MVADCPSSNYHNLFPLNSTSTLGATSCQDHRVWACYRYNRDSIVPASESALPKNPLIYRHWHKCSAISALEHVKPGRNKNVEPLLSGRRPEHGIQTSEAPSGFFGPSCYLGLAAVFTRRGLRFICAVDTYSKWPLSARKRHDTRFDSSFNDMSNIPASVATGVFGIWASSAYRQTS